LVAIAFLTTGAVLSRRVEPGVCVKTVTIAGDTPALQFRPANLGPHPIALLAHGATGSKESLFRFGEAFAAAGFVCFAVDFPGHGASARSFSVNDTVRTLEEVARTLGSVDVFVGHSMGAGAGAKAVRAGGLRPLLFMAVGANPDLGENAPPLLLLVGQFEEFVRPVRLKARTDVRLANLRPKNVDSPPANPLAPTVTNDEKLPEVNLLRLLSKQRVSHDLAAILVNYGPIAAWLGRSGVHAPERTSTESWKRCLRVQKESGRRKSSLNRPASRLELGRAGR
jgi:pimeloyl-ACP methyl ester carboxylesterase